MSSEREAEIAYLAQRQYRHHDDIVIDNDAAVSEGDDNGAYVQAWVWVSFSDTPLDKERVNA